MKCAHYFLRVRRHPDGCYTLECQYCDARGSKAHGKTLAILAFLIRAKDRHPRVKRR